MTLSETKAEPEGAPPDVLVTTVFHVARSLLVGTLNADAGLALETP